MRAVRAHATRLATRAAPLARAYAAILLCESPWVGLWFAAVGWFAPSAALAGLAGLFASAAWAGLLGLRMPGDPHLVNALLTGLIAGAFFHLDLPLLALIVAGSLLVTLCSHWLAAALWRAGKLPVLSLPFVLAIWVLILITEASAGAGPTLRALPLAYEVSFAPALDRFFSAVGWLLAVPSPLAGSLLFGGLLVASRYLTSLAVAGYVVGAQALDVVGGNYTPVTGLNCMLTAMALGGVFAVPGWGSFLAALAGSALTAGLAVALGPLLLPVQLPLLTLPFILAVLVFLGGLGTRAAVRPVRLNLDAPGSPEASWERARLAAARGSEAGSVSLAAPFYGEWRVAQGFDGPHTHRPPWGNALDFDIPLGGDFDRTAVREFAGYPCYGAPVLSPVAGQLVRFRDDLPDNRPGEVDTANNWGNFALLRIDGGHFILLAHLKQGSVIPQRDDWVKLGQAVAACGNSGRSPAPHLHLQVQADDRLGSPTVPFHLAHAVLRRESGEREFQLCCRPAEGDRVSAAPRDEAIAAALHLPPGAFWTYRVTSGDSPGDATWRLRSRLTLLGQPRLTTDGGASVAYEETPAVIGVYDRRGATDPMLDAWALALGLTPLSAVATRWNDRPSMKLLPLGAGRHLIAALVRPLGAGCDSSYRRRWDDAAGAWVQEGEHLLRLAPGLRWLVSTTAWIVPRAGVRRLRSEGLGVTREAELVASGSVEEAGDDADRT